MSELALCIVCGQATVIADLIEQMCPRCLMDTLMSVSAPTTLAPTVELETSGAADSIPSIFKPGSFKHYNMIRELGSGGMGVVYLAHDTKLGRNVAIKLLPDLDIERRQRFLQEARATARCIHENIVTIYEVDQHHGRPYIALEYIEGQTLAEYLTSRGPIGPHEAVRLISPVVRALICAHSNGVTHRDLKPQNIMITASGVIKVLDFGIAKIKSPGRGGATTANSSDGGSDISLTTRTGSLLGTAPYMSPEQWKSQGVDHASDIWAIGIILYEMLTGQHPLAPVTWERLQTVADLSQPMPSACDMGRAPGPLGLIIDDCLRKSKPDRIATAQQLMTRLESLVPGYAPIRDYVGDGSAPAWAPHVNTDGSSLHFWNKKSLEFSLTHKCMGPADPSVLLVAVHGATRDPHRAWGDLLRRALDSIGSDADAICYPDSATLVQEIGVTEAAERLRKILLGRSPSYMHLFFVTDTAGSYIVKELLARDVESAAPGSSEELSKIPPVTGKTRLVFNFSSQLVATDAPPPEEIEQTEYTGLVKRLRAALDLLQKNDLPRPRFLDLVRSENSNDILAEPMISSHGAVLETPIEDSDQGVAKEFDPGSSSHLEAVASRLRPYFNSPGMTVAYVTLRRVMGTDGGITPTPGATEISLAEGELAQSDWVGWRGSQQFILNRIIELTSPHRIRQQRRLVITGSAGVGKSTVLRRYARYAAARCLEGRTGALVCFFIPMQNLTMDASQVALMPPNGTAKEGWALLSRYWSTLFTEILLDAREEVAFAGITPCDSILEWKRLGALVTPAWIQSLITTQSAEIILDSVDEFLVNNSSITVVTIAELLEFLEELPPSSHTHCILGARNTLPALAELSRNTTGAHEIYPLDESAAEALFPGTRELLGRLHDPSLRRLVLSPLVLIRLGPSVKLLHHGLLSTRVAIFSQALNALLDQSLPVHGKSSPGGLPGWIQALMLTAWTLYRDNLGSITVAVLKERIRELREIWSHDTHRSHHGFSDGFAICENDSSFNILRTRTVLNNIGRESVWFTHREWQDFLVAGYLAQCAIGRRFKELDHRAFSKSIYIDAAEIMWKEMSLAQSKIRQDWIEEAFPASAPFAHPYAFMSICALLGNGPIDVDQSAFRRLLELLCDPRCPEVSRLVAVSSFCMRVLRRDKRDQSIRYMLSELLFAIDKIVRQGAEPQRKVSASMAWCYRKALTGHYPHVQGAGTEEWPRLSATTEHGVAAAGASGVVWRNESNSIIVDARHRSFQIAAAQYSLAVRDLPHEEISLTHYLFLAAAAVRAGASASELYPLLRTIFSEQSGVVARIERSSLPEVKELFESCHEAVRHIVDDSLPTI